MKIDSMLIMDGDKALVKTASGSLHKADNVEHVGVSRDHKSVYKATVHFGSAKTAAGINPKYAKATHGGVA